MFLTVLDIFEAENPGLEPNLANFLETDLPFIGGCQACNATVACFNACPSKTGFLLCKNGCIGDLGFRTLEEFRAWED